MVTIFISDANHQFFGQISKTLQDSDQFQNTKLALYDDLLFYYCRKVQTKCTLSLTSCKKMCVMETLHINHIKGYVIEYTENNAISDELIDKTIPLTTVVLPRQ